MTPPPTRRAIRGARFAVFFTAAGWAIYTADQVRRLSAGPLEARRVTEAVVYLLVVTLLAGSAEAYLVARLGSLVRAADHRRISRVLIDRHFDTSMPTLTVLVPSYREDARVIRQTLLSAALQEYPQLRVVLLVDDPPAPQDAEQRRLLDEALEVPRQLADLLAGPRRRFDRAMDRFEAQLGWETEATPEMLATLATEYAAAAEWFEHQAAFVAVEDPSDEFLAREVLGRQAADLRQIDEALSLAAEHGERVSVQRLRHLYRRLAWTFRAELGSFQRKRYDSLSHEANKAMNLNSYLGLMGGRYVVRAGAAGTVLVPVRSGPADLEVPDSEYVLTLDADSMLLPEYCLRLVHFLEQPEHAGVAVVQTPYSSYPGALTRIERIAGATTDLQYLVHQGLARHDAAFWVGANAVLRKAALDDIVEIDHERGFEIRRYIQDRTVIEDTESSLDLREHGWAIHNYPERLSYSATPPDFGALCVQRQRWANGGLLMLPKLWRLARRRDGRSRRAHAREIWLRGNYLASLGWSSYSLLLLLAYPFDDSLLNRFAVLMSLPYFAAMANDLRRLGYHRTDAIRIYGFNLLLLPVNLSGVSKSIGQAIGGQKIPFARTPKVARRTVAPWPFVVVPALIVAWSTYALIQDLLTDRFVHAGFAGLNAALTAYALAAFVGPVAAVVDVVVNAREFVLRPARAAGPTAPAPDWTAVLYHGPRVAGETTVGALHAAALAVAEKLPGDEVHPAAEPVPVASAEPPAPPEVRREAPAQLRRVRV